MFRLDHNDTHLALDRRRFLLELSRLAGASVVATVIGPILTPDAAQATIVAEDDPRLIAGAHMIRARYGLVSSYLARPRGAAAPRPCILVLHDDYGLGAHVRDVTRRLALEGFVALAPDFLWRSGGTPDDLDKARDLISALDDNEVLVVALAGIEDLMARRDTLRRVGAIGFGWGGTLVNRLASNSRDLTGVVSFYGQPPDIRSVARIRTRLMQHYAELDNRGNASLPEFRRALDRAGVDYTMHMYQSAKGGFHDHTADAVYDQRSAELAWTRTIAFFKEVLSSG